MDMKYYEVGLDYQMIQVIILKWLHKLRSVRFIVFFKKTSSKELISVYMRY